MIDGMLCFAGMATDKNEPQPPTEQVVKAPAGPEAPRRPDVFVSYTRDDERNGSRTHALIDLLTKQGFNVFWDQSFELKGVDRWASVLQQALEQARLVIVLWTPRSVKSDWVQKEAGMASGADKLLPVLFDDVEIPKPYAMFQHIDLRGWNGEPEHRGLTMLIDAVRAKVTGAATAPDRTTATKGEPDSAPGATESPTQVQQSAVASAADQSESSPSSARSDVPTHTDEPATARDLLNRKPLARFLAEDLRRTREQNRGSYVMHVHGPWGSGKTSLLNFVRDELERPTERPGDEGRQWIVIDFNAWRHQRFEQPWWWLMEAVSVQARRRLRSREWSQTDGQRWRRAARARWIWLTDRAWTLLKGRGWTVLAIAVFSLVLGALLVASFSWLRNLQVQDASDIVKLVSATLGVATVIAGAIVGVAKSFTRGAAQAIRTLVESSSNPVRFLKEHFERLIERIRDPVAIMIDDLDRCQSAYVVELLEGIQTLFRECPVTFIVAADRNWIHGSYQQVYHGYENHLSANSGKLGQLFLEKMFQTSVPVPSPDDGTRHRYYQYLIGTQKSERSEPQEQLRKRARISVQNLRTEAAVVEEFQRHDDDLEYRQVFMEEAMAKLADPEVVEQTQHVLDGFADAVEFNPRSMKRFVNAYRINRALDLAKYGSTPPDHLARWTILNQRWLALATYLTTYPHKVHDAVRGRDEDHPDNPLPKEITALCTRRDVRRVLGVNDDGTVAMTPDVLESLTERLFPYQV